VFRLFAFLGACSLCMSAGDDPLREVTSQAAIVENHLLPVFYKGYIY